MKKVLAQATGLLKKAASALVAALPTLLTLLGKSRQLQAVAAAGVVAVAAHLFGVHLTVAEVAGWIAILTVAAAAVEHRPAPKAPPKA